MKARLFKCETCGNIILKIIDSKITPSCCGHQMTEILPEVIEGKEDYHIPVVCKYDDDELHVCIGKELHPMTQEHHIQFVILQTPNGCFVKKLKPDTEPVVSFPSVRHIPFTVYVYCNIHGLWKKEFCTQSTRNNESKP